MVEESTVSLINEELQRLSEFLDDPIPPWDFVGGDTSAFIHPIGEFDCTKCGAPRSVVFAGQRAVMRCPSCGAIFFAQPVIEEFERLGELDELVGLVAHEFWHWHQFRHNLHQDNPEIREVNARRFAQQWVTQRFPGGQTTLDTQPITAVEKSLPTEPGIVVDGQQVRLPPEVRPEVTPEDILFLRESFKPIGRPPPISISKWIRFKFQRDGENYPYRMWRDYQRFMTVLGFPAASYTGFRRMIWMVHHIGLIEFVREEETDFGVRRIYRIVPERASSPAWFNPQAELYG